MRKFVVFTLTFLFVVMLQSNVSAQQYFVYDGKSFSVMLTTNDDNTEIENVQFSSAGKWVDFEVVDYEDWEDTETGGFAFICKDRKGIPFRVDYYRDEDYIVVANENTGDTWTLNKREE